LVFNSELLGHPITPSLLSCHARFARSRNHCVSTIPSQPHRESIAHLKTKEESACSRTIAQKEDVRRTVQVVKNPVKLSAQVHAVLLLEHTGGAGQGQF